VSERCSDVSTAAGEPLGATATSAMHWLLVEVPGAWPRDVGEGDGLPREARDRAQSWLAEHERSRLQFIRRLGRKGPALLAYVVRSQERSSEVRRIELGGLHDLAEIDLESAGEPIERSLVLVCGHGSRDRCCASRGTELFGVLESRLEEEELWISSHQGGHRFAPNLLVLPAGLQFGRVAAKDAPSVAARALAGRIELDCYRGRTCYSGPVQAAELAARRASQLAGVDEISLEAVEDAVTTFRTWDGREYTVVVREMVGPSVPASCGAESEPQLHFVAESVTENPAVSRAADTRDR
jgi:hypothetical protein